MILKDVKFCLRSFIEIASTLEKFGGGKRCKSSEFHLFLNIIKRSESIGTLTLKNLFVKTLRKYHITVSPFSNASLK